MLSFNISSTNKAIPIKMGNQSCTQETKIDKFQLDVSETALKTLSQANDSTSLLEPPFIESDPYGDLEPLENGKIILNEVVEFLKSPLVLEACNCSQSLNILQNRLATSLFHLNFTPIVVNKKEPKYEYIDSKYPYDPVFDKPFPKRPTIEAIDEFIRFATQIENFPNTLLTEEKRIQLSLDARNITKKLLSDHAYKCFMKELDLRCTVLPITPDEISKETILNRPVDSYLKMHKRIKKYGEVASFPEFASPVKKCLDDLKTDGHIRELADKDPIFKAEVNNAIEGLESVLPNPALPESGAYPYRRTISVIERALGVFDMKERMIYPESSNWFEVEESWNLPGNQKMLLPLYHFNRYKYQQFGLLANPNVVLLPWESDASFEDLIRLRSAPIGMIGVVSGTLRADRHYNSPLDFWYHDINHIRRMWGYDKRRAQTCELDTRKLLKNDLKNREQFIEELLRKTDPNKIELSPEQRQIRHIERAIIFEVFHETALCASKEAVLNDLTRKPGIRQPFEVQRQDEKYMKELNRTFDGNLKSGANLLSLDLSRPTVIEYYFERAPGFLSNVYNKIAWGFYESVFVDRGNQEMVIYRTPENMAEAVINILKHLECPQIPSKNDLVEEITNRSGQPELYNYFALNPQDDQSEKGRISINQRKDNDIVKPEIKASRALKKNYPEMAPSEIAMQVMTTEEHKNIIQWMIEDLEKYVMNFDQAFDAKLSRCFPHPFDNTDDFINKFIGNERGKLLKTLPTEEERIKLDSGGVLYVDTWAVPHFNTALQTKEEGLENLKKNLKYFETINLSEGVSIYEYIHLIAVYARPEFDDLRRYKLQLMPTTQAKEKFGLERSDARSIGDNYPTENFLVTNHELSLDDLSFTFGRHIHYLGLISHFETIRADGRVFAGTADFLEHDMSHAYFSLHPAAPGQSKQWKKIHEKFRENAAQVGSRKEKEMDEFIYFHFTHESGYKSMVPSEQGTPRQPNEYKNELFVIQERIKTVNDYDWLKLPGHIGENYMPLLETSFNKIADFFKGKINKLQANTA